MKALRNQPPTLYSAYREPPASLSSTKSFPYDGAWFTPVAHTTSTRKGSKPSWIWAYGEELRDTKSRKHWRYNLCKTSKKTQINSCASNTNRASLHLQAAPHNLRPPKSAQVEDDVEPIPTVVEMVENGKKTIVASLMSVFSIERFPESGGCGALSNNREKKRHNRGGGDNEGGS
jgi:hypothetical protein